MQVDRNGIKTVNAQIPQTDIDGIRGFPLAVPSFTGVDFIIQIQLGTLTANLLSIKYDSGLLSYSIQASPDYSKDFWIDLQAVNNRIQYLGTHVCIPLSFVPSSAFGEYSTFANFTNNGAAIFTEFAFIRLT